MPRSAADATRFTATGPYAHSKAGVGTTIDVSTPPPNETPSQKVARLRAAAQKARLASESGTGWDRVVARGKVWADVAHRVTTMGLIGLSAIAGIVTVVALGDMMIYNRRKRKDFYKAQQENYNKVLGLALKAEAEGTLTEDLRVVLDNERAISEAQEKREQKKTTWEKAKAVFTSGPKEEQRGGLLATMGEEAKARVQKIIEGEKESEQNGRTVLEPSPSRTQQSISALPAGGSLDRFAEAATTSLTSTSRGWFNWVTGR